MDLEELTKHQIILLTLLVSFVTSIATGIVTVSLMNQAPPEVSRTINQIVERTVQTVAPASTQGAAVVTTEKTVVVNSDDLAAQSIASVQKAIIRITAKGDDTVLARGIIIDNKGTALTDEAALYNSGATSFDATLVDGTEVPVTVDPEQATSSDLAVIEVAVGTSTAWAPANIADPSKLELGQSVLRIGGKGTDTVGEGVIATLPSSNNSSIIDASVSSTMPGSVLISLFGDVIGITTASSLGESSDTYTLATLPAAPATKAAPQS